MFLLFMPKLSAEKIRALLICINLKQVLGGGGFHENHHTLKAASFCKISQIQEELGSFSKLKLNMTDRG